MDYTEDQKKLFKILDTLGIRFKTYEHEPFFTVEQAKIACAGVPGDWAKNLFLKDSKGRLFLCIMPAHKKANLKELSQKLDAPELRFADAHLLKQHLGVEPGSVTAFGLMLDTNHHVRVILDKSLVQCDELGVHPLKNDATTVISYADLKKFIEFCGNELIEIDLS